ncbi:reverse transcriptase domain-containing protein [uncultured Xanthomonas sp.]|uniref:reverse transcriptase domain-containing protein n=1 Tax=uncultured Xanthomonas sp. TaxID=152831 RepID=UPI0025EB38C5|nr:reverse transcriptase domain-containing protein [uncultured Xanthomonas sp.]
MASLSPNSFGLTEADLIRFLSMASRNELAAWLGISERQLKYVVYAMPLHKKYKVFRIKKKNGGEREISSPADILKRIQRRIASAVDSARTRSLISNGFEKGRSIFDHARPHKGRVFVITADIKDFFPSINFGRVRGVFLAPPFRFNNVVATLLAQLCTDGKSLPQGAPSSPSIANIVCVQLDRLLMELAKKSKCSVTRYADDICFSTGAAQVPKYLAVKNGDDYIPSQALCKILNGNGFEVNSEKFRVCKGKDALVAGLKYRGGIGLPRKWRRRLRSELQVSRKYGAAAANIVAAWDGSDEPKLTGENNELLCVSGKIGFSKWLDGKVGKQRTLALARSYPQLRGVFKAVIPHREIDLLVEGVTDRILLVAALLALQKRGLFLSLKFNFLSSAMKGGADLEKTVKLLAATGARRNLTIALFDSDDGEILAKVGLVPASGVYYRAMAEGVYAVALKPPPWLTAETFCIENLLHPDTFSIEDNLGRRIFLATEFSERNGLHQSGKFFRVKPNKKAIVVDSDVYSTTSGEPVALAKHAFSELVAQGAAPSEDFYGFHETFSLIQEIAYEFGLAAGRT